MAEKKDTSIPLYEQRAQELEKKASAEGIEDKKAERLSTRAENIRERAANRQARREEARQTWSEFKDYWTNPFSTTPLDQVKVEYTSPVNPNLVQQQEVKEEDKKGEGQGEGQGQGGDSSSAEDSITQLTNQYFEAQNKAAEQKANLYSQYIEEARNSRNAYQALFKTALQNKENIALRRERDARSRALANAFGSLLNVMTAGIGGKVGGYVPIVADYNKEPDSILRKSIEARYAMENENENLLLNLEKERKQHEAELLKTGLDSELQAIDASTKSQQDIIKTMLGIEASKIKSDADFERQWALMLKRAALNSNNNSSSGTAAATQKQQQLTQASNDFASAIVTGAYTKGLRGKQNAYTNPNDQKMLAGVYRNKIAPAKLSSNGYQYVIEKLNEMYMNPDTRETITNATKRNEFLNNLIAEAKNL